MKKLFILSTLSTMLAVSSFGAETGTVINKNGSQVWTNADTWLDGDIPTYNDSSIKEFEITFSREEDSTSTEAYLNIAKGSISSGILNYGNGVSFFLTPVLADGIETVTINGGSTSNNSKCQVKIGSLTSGKLIFTGNKDKFYLNGNMATDVTVEFQAKMNNSTWSCTGFKGHLIINESQSTASAPNKIARLSGTGSLSILKGHLTTTAASSSGAGSSVNLQGSSMLQINAGSSFTTTSGLKVMNGDIAGAINVNGWQTGFSNNTDNIQFTMGSKIIFRDTATLNVAAGDTTKSRTYINSGAVVVSEAGEGALKFNQALQLDSNATLIMNTSNAIVNDESGNTKLLVSNYQTSSFDGVADANLKFGYDIDGNKLETPVDTNGDAIVNNIANLDMYDASTLNLWLNGTTLNIGSVSQTGSDSSSIFTLMLQGEVERGSLFVQDFNGLTTLEDVETYITNVSGEDFFVEFANGTSADGGYYIYNVAVPEPAEWAMIFGAIALGFVAYRRRK